MQSDYKYMGGGLGWDDSRTVYHKYSCYKSIFR